MTFKETLKSIKNANKNVDKVLRAARLQRVERKATAIPLALDGGLRCQK